MKSHEQIKIELSNLLKVVKSISDSHFENLSVILINYYNLLNAILNDTDTPKVKKDKLINELYDKFQIKSLEELTDMLEEIYSTTSSTIRDIYELNDENLPISKIQFYDKDNITIEQRLSRWFNPNSEDYLKDKIQALNKMKQISNSEAINEMNTVEYDKLFNNCTVFEIYNDDEDDECSETVECRLYWGNYKITDELPPMPAYHPDCECHVAYYFD